jgi:cyanate permease
MSLLFASRLSVPAPGAGVATLVAGIGAFGWVGLYLALAAEAGGSRSAGLLTGVAVSCSWSGVLVGPPLFGCLLDATGADHVPWLVLAATSIVAIAMSRIPPLLKRDL